MNDNYFGGNRGQVRGGSNRAYNPRFVQNTISTRPYAHGHGGQHRPFVPRPPGPGPGFRTFRPRGPPPQIPASFPLGPRPPMPVLVPVKIVTFIAPDYFTVLCETMSDSIYFDSQIGLGREWSKAARKFSNDFVPALNMHVIYKELPEDNLGRRAIIKNTPGPRFPESYRIFLYDEGIFINCSIEHIKPMDISWFRKLQPRSLICTLPGLIPLDNVSRGGSDLSLNSSTWSKSAYSFAQDWFKYGSTNIHILRNYGDVEVYGDIYISNDPRPLSRHLQDNKYASLSQDLFDKQFQLSPNVSTSGLPDRNMNQPLPQSQPVHQQSGNSAPPNRFPGGSGTVHVPMASSTAVRPSNCTNKEPLPPRPTYPNSNEIPRSILKRPSETITGSWRKNVDTQNQSAAHRQEININNMDEYPSLPSSDHSSGKASSESNDTGKQVDPEKSVLQKPDQPDLEINPIQMLVFEAKSEYSRIKVKVPPKKTFMRGNDLLPPVVDFGTMDIPANIKNALLTELEVSQLNSLQRHAWPQLFQGRHCTIIGGTNNRKGKTLSYLVPLVVQSINFNEEFKRKNNGKSGLIALIIVANSKSGAKVYNQLVKLTSEYPISTTYISTPEPTEEQFQEIKDGAAIIVAIAECLEALSLRPKDFFTLPSLKILAIDDSHITLHKSLYLVIQVVRRIKVNSQKLGYCQSQLILCGKEWNQYVASFSQEVLKDPVLIIGNPVEAVIFGKVNFHIYEPMEIPTDQRVTALVKELPTSRILILCNNEISVIGLCSTIYRRTRISVIPVTDEIRSSKQSLQDIADIWDNWSGEKKLVCIATATALNDLPIHNANILIHFQIDYKNAEAFWSRHAAMWDLFPKIEDNSPELEEPKMSALSSYVFIDTDDENYYKIVQKCKDLEVEIPIELSKSAEKLSVEAQKDLPLCDALISQGKCIDPDCRSRHGFLDMEIMQETTTPKTGGIEVEIVESLDVNRYLAKLIKTYDYNQDGVTNLYDYAKDFENLDLMLKEYYENPENLKTVLTPEINVECVSEYKPAASGFARCRITQIYANNPIPSIRVFCYDYGIYMTRKAGQLYQIPEVFLAIKPYCIEVILSKLKPPNSAIGFTPSSKLEANKLIGTKFTGKICLAMGNKVWVSYLYVYKKSKTGFWIKEKDVAGDFIYQKIAEKNPDHVVNLEQLLKDLDKNCLLYPTNESKVENIEGLNSETGLENSSDIDEDDYLPPKARKDNLKKYNEQVNNFLNGAEDDSEDDDVEGFSMYMDEASAKRIAEKLGLPGNQNQQTQKVQFAA